MEEKTLNISKEELDNLSIEQLADLKVEVDELLHTIDILIEECKED